jgi:hypothetical protein
MINKLEGTRAVIPSISQAVKMAESIPEGVGRAVTTTGSRPQSRNREARLAKAKVTASCNDDTSLSEDSSGRHAPSKKEDEIIGLESYDFGLPLTRFMVISRGEFELIGGFDESLNRMGDTDTCIRAKFAGLKLTNVPVDSVIRVKLGCRIGDMGRGIPYRRVFTKHPLQFVIPFVHMFCKRMPPGDP